MPRLDRGIQYSAATVGSHNSRCGVLDRPPSRAMTPSMWINYRIRSRSAASCRPSCWQSPR
ncbi:hypothetical protein DXU04_04510 [Bradyrhizobium diazoefficiens]